MHQHQLPREIIKYKLLGPTPRVSDSVGLELGLRVCLSNTLPAVAAGVGNTLQEPLSYSIVLVDKIPQLLVLALVFSL